MSSKLIPILLFLLFSLAKATGLSSRIAQDNALDQPTVIFERVGLSAEVVCTLHAAHEMSIPISYNETQKRFRCRAQPLKSTRPTSDRINLHDKPALIAAIARVVREREEKEMDKLLRTISARIEAVQKRKDEAQRAIKEEKHLKIKVTRKLFELLQLIAVDLVYMTTLDEQANLVLQVEKTQISAEGRPKGAVPVNFGIVLFPGFQALDAFGPLDALNTLSYMFPMNLSILAESLDPISTKSPLQVPNIVGSDFGQSINPTHTFATAPPLDVLLIPGGIGAMHPDIQSAIDFVKKTYPSLQYLITVCNGAGIAARAGVLDGKKATTNKIFWQTETAQRDAVKWVAHARWVVDGNIWTSSGVSAGLDAVFAFMAAIYGEEVAEKVSNMLEYERHRDPNWDPYATLAGLPKE
ncbi:hypothetical protein H0H93_012345 [Arthromyces matolae]|nr:hypothetical protein H0H93_012345 [Arthromyces matolae]